MPGRRVVRALVLLLSLSALGASADDQAFIAGVFSPPRLAPEFSLRGSDGTTLNLSRYRGKVVLLAFGYTSCTEVCPVTLSILAQARRTLQAAANELQILYITVDPDRDTALRMKRFVTAFDPSFVGGTGTSQQLAAVRAAYGISVGEKVSIPGGYALSHSSFTYLIDRDGKLRALMPFGHSAEDFAHDVRLLVQQ